MESRVCVNCEKMLPIMMYDYSVGKDDKIYYRNKCKSCRLIDKQCNIKNKKNSEKEIITIKQCNICNTTKNCADFSKRSVSVDGYQSCCKDCYSKKRWKNKDKAIIESTLRDKLCNTCSVIKDISLFKSNKKSKDGYYHKCNDCWKPREWNAEKERNSQRKYIETHRDKIRDKYRRQGLNINRRIRQSLNCRISQLLKRNSLSKNNRTLKYVGCDFHFLKCWFEFQFQENMNWNNYGEWEIDHVIPCCSFNLENIEEQLICFKWSNLSPCWKIDNIKKGDKIVDSILQQHKIKVDKFLSINPLPTPPGNRVEGTE